MRDKVAQCQKRQEDFLREITSAINKGDNAAAFQLAMDFCNAYGRLAKEVMELESHVETHKNTISGLQDRLHGIYNVVVGGGPGHSHSKRPRRGLKRE